MFKEHKRVLSSELQNTGMEISAEFGRDELSFALLTVSAAQIEPDIGWVQLVFSGDRKVIISSISHTLAIKYELDVAHVGSGVVKVSGRQFYEYIRQLPTDKVKLSVEMPLQIKLRSGRSSAKIQLVQDQSQTKVEVPTIGTHVVVKGKNLDRWVASFKDFISVDDTRFYANGALVWAEKKPLQDGLSIHSVASDARYLAKTTLTEGVKEENLETKNAHTDQVIVPKKALEELKRVVALNPDKEFHLKWSEQSLFFSVESENYTMLAKCIAGQYPPYAAALPQTINLKVQIDLKSIRESVKRSLIFADKNKILALHFENSLLTMASMTPGQKEGEEIMETQSQAPSPFEVNYNGKLLTDILSVISGSVVQFEWENTNRPVKMTGEEERGIEVFYLLVPARF